MRSRFLRLLLALTAVGLAFCVTFVWPRHNALDFDIDSSPRAQAAKKRAPYDLADARVLRAVIAKTNNNYVDPARIDHKRMLLSGLDAIQRGVAPVLIDYDQDSPTFNVQVGSDSREYRADDVNSPWALTYRFKQVFGFLQKHLQQDEDVDLREVEYAAVNGMLRTLDPHSVLLDPDEYEEMKLSTRGEFGGLGIVISIRDGRLTIIRPMPDTPASRAGLKKGDRIVQIDEESTLNMPLEEAVSRLRGTPGAAVGVWIVREGNKGWTKPRRFDIVRDRIHIESSESRMLANRIGYVRISNFQSSTCDDVQAALKKLHSQEMRGLVLDMRDNPGGLLQQAICIADLFLSSGTIVTTSSNDPSKDERKLAKSQGTEPRYPIVVLQNGSSASASEIVAGALKNHDRALLMGGSTFGKGSVQVLYPDDQDGWALKLTIAQYLTPGDVSIQGVGIVPDIGIEPMTVDPLDIDLAVMRSHLREADLSAHLTHATAHEAEQPSEIVRYYLPQETRQRLREASPEELEENEREGEFLTRFAGDLLAAATRPGRRELLRDAARVIETTQAKELGLAETELRKLGVDWRVGPDRGASEIEVQVTTSQPDNVGTAGKPFELKVAVTNKGKAPLFRLRAVTKSDNPLFHERELVFGRVNPGETKRWSTTLGVCRTEDEQRKCLLPAYLIDRADGIRIEFAEQHEHAPPPVETRVRVEALPRPEFAYTVHVADDVRGDGDGNLEPGERASVYLRMRNVGKGASEETVANLRNLSGRGVLLRAGRFQLGELKPGEEATVRFTFDLLDDFSQDETKLEVSMADTDQRVQAGEKLRLPIQRSDLAVKPASGQMVYLKADTRIFARPTAGARAIAQVVGGAVSLPVQATTEDHLRVDLGDGRPGWVERAATTTRASGGRIADVLAHMPPKLEVDLGGKLVVREPKIELKATAHHDALLRDLYIFVGSRKVFYRSNLGAKDPKRMDVTTTLPLRPGVNFITVVARESNEVLTREVLVMRRDGPDGALLETPKNGDEDPFFWDEE